MRRFWSFFCGHFFFLKCSSFRKKIRCFYDRKMTVFLIASKRVKNPWFQNVIRMIITKRGDPIISKCRASVISKCGSPSYQNECCFPLKTKAIPVISKWGRLGLIYNQSKINLKRISKWPSFIILIWSSFWNGIPINREEFGGRREPAPLFYRFPSSWQNKTGFVTAS